MSSLEIDVAATKSLLDAGECVLIDCREAQEYEVARIDGSILMPMSEWASVQQELENHQGKHLVVHCHHGMRSLQVVQWLRSKCPWKPFGFRHSQF